jgi:hypothetical protein
MRRAPLWAVTVSAALVAAVAAGLRAGALPLGVRGEWEWLRVRHGPTAIDLGLAAVGVGLYAGFAAFVWKGLAARATWLRESAAVTALVATAAAVQAVAQSGAPVGYGLAKWVIALHESGSSGYFRLARWAAHDLGPFLAAYPGWIKRQDALHIGTHPPGLIATEAGLLRLMEGSPGLARFVEGHSPDSVALAFRIHTQYNRLTLPDRATLVATGALTLLCCAATVAPLYLLARATLPAPSAWAAAALWPLVPSAVLFQPTADTAYPLLSTTAFALAAWAGRWPGRSGAVAAAACGVVLGVGMQYSLAFLAVGLVEAVVLATAAGVDVRGRLGLILATGAGFLGLTAAVWAATAANPFVIWWWNQKNHARFYVEFPRSYRAWVVANPVELAVGLGLPNAVWALLGFARPRGGPRVGVASALVLAALTLSGRNLSEVGRLWLPFMPALLVTAGSAFDRAGAGAKSLAATVALLGAQTLALEATIQVVYPVS